MAETLFPVAAPAAAAPPTGLLVAVPVVAGGGDEYRQGVTFTPETGGGWRVLSVCNAEATVDHDEDAESTRVTARVVTLEFSDPCRRTVARSSAEAEARLRRVIDATESAALARELWTGELAIAEEDADPELANSPRLTKVHPDHVLSAAAVSPKRAVGLLQAAVMRNGGGRAFLHASPEVAAYLPDLSRTGNLLETNLGSVVVVDAGYPGTGPDGEEPAVGQGWLYATGRVQVWRESAAVFEETYDERHNRVDLVGLRAYVPAFDPAFLFAVPVTLT